MFITQLNEYLFYEKINMERKDRFGINTEFF